MGGAPAMSDFSMNPLGPAGVNSRIAELQSRLDALSPRPRPTTTPTSTTGAGAMTFGQILKPMCPSVDQLNPLSGAIGGAGQDELRTMAQAAAEKNGVPPALFQALVQQESAWNPQAVSHAGAKGLCQLMDDTARGLGVTDPFDPQQSLDGGARYLRQMLDKFGGNPATALAAYNAGPGFVSRHNPAQWPSETKGYVRTILSNSGAA